MGKTMMDAFYDMPKGEQKKYVRALLGIFDDELLDEDRIEKEINPNRYLVHAMESLSKGRN